MTIALMLLAFSLSWPLGAWAGGPTVASGDRLALYLAGGALAGGLLRAWVTYGANFFRDRKSIADLVITGAIGFLWPVAAGPLGIELPGGMIQQAVMVGAIAYFAGDLLINFFNKVVKDRLKAVVGQEPSPPK